VIAIVLLCHWCLREELFSFLPSSPLGKAFILLVGIGIPVLLLHNLRDQPVSRITGQVKLPCEVVDVIVLGSIAEEVVFRGAMWSMFERLSGKEKGQVIALVGTSVLFGVSHIGYWAQSTWPLPSGAYVHAISTALAGLFFGVFRLKTRSLIVPISVHMLANGIILSAQ
jgi:membrane protease YdiL (CAAX protease family)